MGNIELIAEQGTPAILEYFERVIKTMIELSDKVEDHEKKLELSREAAIFFQVRQLIIEVEGDLGENEAQKYFLRWLALTKEANPELEKA